MPDLGKVGKIEITISAKTKYAPGTGIRWRIAQWLIDLGCRIAHTTVEIEAKMDDKKFKVNQLWNRKKK